MANHGRGPRIKFKPEHVEQIRNYYRLGATDEEVAGFIGVNRTTLWRWQTDHPELTEAMKAGKAEADERVVNALFHKAVGYTFQSEKLFQHNGAVIRAKCVEHVPPDTTAMIWWLKNRRPDEWRDRKELDLSNRDGTLAGAWAAALMDDSDVSAAEPNKQH